MTSYEKTGYLNTDFKIFHLSDQNLSPVPFHYHDFQKIILFLRGNVLYSIEGKTYPLHPYDIILVQAGEVHRPVFLDSSVYERIIIYVSTDFIHSYKEKGTDLNCCFDKAQKEHSSVLRLAMLPSGKLFQVCSELEHSYNDYEYANELYRQILFLEFLIQLNRAAINGTVSYLNTYDADSRITKVLSYIQKHLTEELHAEALASSVYMSKYHFMHIFKEETGYSLGKYIANKRLLYAKELIETGSSVTDACFQCGFQSYSAFSRAYKAQFGQPATLDRLKTDKKISIE